MRIVDELAKLTKLRQDGAISENELAQAEGALFSGAALVTYEIIARLGQGGMGEVFRARDTKLGREVALKIIREGVGQETERLARFHREARLLAALNHPNVATLHALEEADGIPFLVMELVPGQSLSARLESGTMSVPEVLDVGRQITEALAGAREQGIIHRDLKPANVMVTPGGHVKVLDFGLAKALRRNVELPATTLSYEEQTAEGRILGTPAYMSPEQVRGRELDERTDTWSLGCILFEALTGSKPFRGPTLADSFAEILHREPDWALLPPHVPSDLRALLMHCLRKEAPNRASVDDLLAFFQGRSVPFPSGTSAPVVQAQLVVEGDPAFSSTVLVGGGDEQTSIQHVAQPVSPTWQRKVVPWAIIAGLGMVVLALSLYLYFGSSSDKEPAAERREPQKTPEEPDFAAAMNVLQKMMDGEGGLRVPMPHFGRRGGPTDSLAVLPFNDEGEFGFSMRERVAHQLWLESRGVQRTRDRVMVMKWTSPQEAGRALGVEYVLSGTIEPNQTIRVKLIKVADGIVVWEKSYADYQSKDGVAQDIAAELRALPDAE